MAAAVLAVIALALLVPDEVRLGPVWLLPAIEGVLLGAVIAGDPSRISRRSNVLRGLSLLLVAMLVIAGLWSTVHLIDGLIRGSTLTQSASDLLEAGALVWGSNIVAFALLYWELDGGGAAARAHGLPTQVDFAFPQQINPDLAPRHWRSQFVDHLYLSLTNALAFSPTDAMPLTPWAKIAMASQSLMSLAILALVVARAVNVFT